ncbi:hypothetical protein MtrunA17_Chr3g0112841 [Medicago truncatula]|uniref:Transmembrane protein n=1 Tax=Medicago truncatula TaxID=3880 RepID=A0A396IUH7_MEDTR|nr:hypothetical protein MtrunA17_Chr3g0112841 [Medicago truncatula]
MTHHYHYYHRLTILWNTVVGLLIILHFLICLNTMPQKFVYEKPKLWSNSSEYIHQIYFVDLQDPSPFKLLDNYVAFLDRLEGDGMNFNPSSDASFNDICWYLCWVKCDHMMVYRHLPKGLMMQYGQVQTILLHIVLDPEGVYCWRHPSISYRVAFSNSIGYLI